MMQYSLSRLTPSTARWLSKNLNDQGVLQNFLDKLAVFLATAGETKADLDLVYSTATELSANGIVDKLPIEYLAELESGVDGSRIAAFRQGLPSQVRQTIDSFKSSKSVFSKITPKLDSVSETDELSISPETVKDILDEPIHEVYIPQVKTRTKQRFLLDPLDRLVSKRIATAKVIKKIAKKRRLKNKFGYDPSGVVLVKTAGQMATVKAGQIVKINGPHVIRLSLDSSGNPLFDSSGTPLFTIGGTSTLKNLRGRSSHGLNQLKPKRRG